MESIRLHLAMKPYDSLADRTLYRAHTCSQFDRYTMLQRSTTFVRCTDERWALVSPRNYPTMYMYLKVSRYAMACRSDDTQRENGCCAEHVARRCASVSRKVGVLHSPKIMLQDPVDCILYCTLPYTPRDCSTVTLKYTSLQFHINYNGRRLGRRAMTSAGLVYQVVW